MQRLITQYAARRGDKITSATLLPRFPPALLEENVSPVARVAGVLEQPLPLGCRQEARQVNCQYSRFIFSRSLRYASTVMCFACRPTRSISRIADQSS